MLRAGLVVAMILALGLSAIGCGSDEDEVNLPTRRVAVEPDPPGSPRTLQRLTPRQRTEARRLIARDDRFSRIVGGRGYRLDRIVPWGTEDRRGTYFKEVLIGTFSEAVLNKPRPLVVADWTFLDYPKAGHPAYLVKTAHLPVHGLRSMFVNVDLKRGEVAGISPFKADKIDYPSNWPTRQPTGE
jgi:hypothetical protein